MKKCFYTYLALALLMPWAAFSQTTVHSVADTSYNDDNSIAYIVNATVVSEVGKNTLTLEISNGTSDIGEIFDLAIYRDFDARHADRPRIAKQVPLPANGIFIFEDVHAEWIDDGGGDYGYTGVGELPANKPYFYSFNIARLDAFGGTTRPTRSYPAIHLEGDPTEVVVDEINDDMTLVTQVFPNHMDSTVILKMDFAPDYSYYQQVLLEALPGSPLSPAGNKPVFYAKTYLNNMADPNGRTDIQYGNLFWGHEGSAYAKFKVDASFMDANNVTYAWFTSGRPGHDTTVPVPIDLSEPVMINTDETAEPVKFDISPNPTNGLINIELSGHVDQLNVYNVSGQVVFSQSMDSETALTTQIDLSDKPAGLYYVQLKSNNYFLTKKVVVK